MSSTSARLQFCDTNVFVYAYDLSASAKRAKARLLLEELWNSLSGVVSIQILQELCVAFTRKSAVSANDARQIIDDLTTWRVIEPSSSDILDAIDHTARYGISLWDAMIVVAAKKADAAVIWSEDLNDGQDYEGVRVVNPFR